MQYGDVRNVFQAAKEKKIPVTKAEQVFLANQLASGLQHIHSKVASLVLTESTLLNCAQGIVMMDLSAKNLFLHTNNVLKIADFSLAQPYDAGEKHYILKARLKLSLRWLAVETYTANPKVFSGSTVEENTPLTRYQQRLVMSGLMASLCGSS